MSVTSDIRDLLAERDAAMSDDLDVRADWFDRKAALFGALADHPDTAEENRTAAAIASAKARTHAVTLRAQATAPRLVEQLVNEHRASFSHLLPADAIVRECRG